MVLGADGSGTYTNCNGVIDGTVAGNKLVGTWTQGTWPGCDAAEPSGRFEFTLATDGRSWSGWWSYAKDAARRGWSGTCSAGACLRNSKAGAAPGGPLYLRLELPRGTGFRISQPVRATFTAVKHHAAAKAIRWYAMWASDNRTGEQHAFPRGYAYEQEYLTKQGEWLHYGYSGSRHNPYAFQYTCGPGTMTWRTALYYSPGTGGKIAVAISNTVRVTCRWRAK
jgi:hypothetical protein